MAKKIDDELQSMFPMQKCHKCGKEFYLRDGWVFKRLIPWYKSGSNTKKTLFFCSWGCLRKYDNKGERK